MTRFSALLAALVLSACAGTPTDRPAPRQDATTKACRSNPYCVVIRPSTLSLSEQERQREELEKASR